MALNVFSVAYPNLILTDFRKQNDLIGYLSTTPTSQMIASGMEAGGPHLTGQMEHISLADTGNLAASGSVNYMSGVFQMQDLSLSAEYPAVAGNSISFLNNRMAIATVKVAYDYEKWHQAGDKMVDFVVEGLAKQMRDEIESAVFSDMYSSAIYASGTTNYDLDTSAQANLLADYEVLATLAEARNWGDGRFIAANTELKHATLGFSQFTSADFGTANNSIAGSGISQFAGFSHIYSNNITAGQAVAFENTKYALVLGTPQVEILKDKDERSSFVRSVIYFGFGSLGYNTTDGDGTAVSQKEGLARITVA